MIIFLYNNKKGGIDMRKCDICGKNEAIYDVCGTNEKICDQCVGGFFTCPGCGNIYRQDDFENGDNGNG